MSFSGGEHSVPARCGEGGKLLLITGTTPWTLRTDGDQQTPGKEVHYCRERERVARASLRRDRRMLRLLLVLGGLCASVGALELPSYITPCDYNDPDLNGCALREARKSLKEVVNGDRKYRIPKLEPLIIEELKVDQDSDGQAIGFSFVARDCRMTGLSNVEVYAIRLDLKNQHIEYDLGFPRLEIIANYTASGKLLLLPITGTGLANITVIDVNTTYRYNYTLEKKEDGDYAFISDYKLDFKVDGRVHLHLDNLFNGDKVLADNVNTVLNDNWQELVRDIGPSLAEALSQVLTTVLRAMFGTVSMQNAFSGHP